MVFSTQNYLTHRLVSDLTSSLFDTDMQGTMLGINVDYVGDEDDNMDLTRIFFFPSQTGVFTGFCRGTLVHVGPDYDFAENSVTYFK